jgi:hypothetical protein
MKVGFMNADPAACKAHHHGKWPSVLFIVGQVFETTDNGHAVDDFLENASGPRVHHKFDGKVTRLCISKRSSSSSAFFMALKREEREQHLLSPQGSC